MKMGHILVTMLGMTVLAGCAVEPKGNGAIEPSATNRHTVVFNITSGSDDSHPVTMAMQLAGHALDDGRNVVLFFNVKGVQVAVKGVPLMGYRQTWLVADKLAELQKRGAVVLVCPHCMKVESIAADDLVDGVQVADRKKLFGHIGRDTVVFTY